MGCVLAKERMDEILSAMTEKYDIYAPMVFEKEGCFTDLDSIRYGKVSSLAAIEWETKSEYSFKEVLLKIQENLFYFTDDKTNIPVTSDKEVLIFLRSCDMHAVKRLDQMYLHNGPEDFYYKRIREKTKFVLMGCAKSCKRGFCVSMGTNISDNYDMAVNVREDSVEIDVKDEALKAYFAGCEEKAVSPDHVTENNEKVTLPTKLSNETYNNPIWEEYGNRCIACGRCNFVCPTCTCFTMQDIYYKENANVGERRRVWTSCQFESYDEIAGGIRFRKTKGARTRFKVMHKIHDFKERFGYTMCVGCGRCEEICPEYISYITILNRLAKEEN